MVEDKPITTLPTNSATVLIKSHNEKKNKTIQDQVTTLI